MRAATWGIVATIFLTVLATHDAEAQTEAPDCSALKSAAKRLACYDKNNASTKMSTEVPIPPKVSTRGSVRGTVSYFFNRNLGAKPDSGTEIILLDREELSIPATIMFFVDADNIILMENKDAERQKFPIFKRTIADGSGNYELRDIPSGKYVLILKSSHARGKDMRDIMGKVSVKPVRIIDGEVDGSNDFGMSYF